MITRAKRQQLSTNTTTTEQTPSHEQATTQPSSRTKGKRKTRDNDTPSNSDSTLPTADRNEQDLDNKIITLIIHQLTHQQDRNTIYECTRVNKQFHSIANPYLYQVLNFDRHHIDTKRFVACHYELDEQQKSRQRHYIRDLRLFGPQWTEARLARLLPDMPELHHFSLLPKTMVTDKSFQHLPKSCQHLTSLTLDNTRLTQVSFNAIGQYCHQLTDLKWILAKHQSPEWLSSLVGHCPLKRLELVLHPPVILHENAMTIIKQFHDLIYLDIHATAPSNTPIHYHHLLTHNAITTTLWHQLTHLSLDPCYDIDDTILIPFLESHTNLQHLKLIHAQQLTDSVLDTIAGLNLTHLTLEATTLKGKQHFSSRAVQQLKQQCPGLDQVSIS